MYNSLLNDLKFWSNAIQLILLFPSTSSKVLVLKQTTSQIRPSVLNAFNVSLKNDGGKIEYDEDAKDDHGGNTVRISVDAISTFGADRALEGWVFCLVGTEITSWTGEPNRLQVFKEAIVVRDDSALRC